MITFIVIVASSVFLVCDWIAKKLRRRGWIPLPEPAPTERVGGYTEGWRDGWNSYRAELLRRAGVSDERD